MQFVSGWVVDSFDVNWVIAAGLHALVACQGGNGSGARIHDAAGDAVDAWHRRVCDESGLLENPQLPFAGASPGLRQWRPTSRGEIRAGSGHFGNWLSNSKVRLATCIHRNRTGQPSLDSGLDQMDAARRNDRALPPWGH